MSFLHLKNKTEPKYTEIGKATILKDVFDIKPKSEKKIVGNSNNSLMIGEGVSITGTIKSNNEVTVQGNIEGDIECNSVTINKSGNVKGKIKTEMMDATSSEYHSFSIPLTVDINSGENWGFAH